MMLFDYFRLQSDLIATLEEILLKGDIDGDKVVDLRDAILALQIQTEQSGGTVRLAGDVYGDRRVGMAEALYVLQVLAH